MDKRELVLCALNHQESAIPLWHMGFENIETAKRLIGHENVPCNLLPELDYKKGASTEEDMLLNIAYAEQLDSSAIGVGKGGNFDFGHGGPGEFLEKLVETGADYYISIYETGTKKEVRSNPHFYRCFDYPVLKPENFDSFDFPNAADTSRYERISHEISFYKDRGYFTYANINGFFSGLHYFLRPFDEILMYMLTEPEFVGKVLKKLGEFNLTAAENLLKCGVDCITFCDDLGSGSSLLFSPEIYRKFFFPWHRELADLCHSYSAYVHMHSHGNISRILGDIVEAGIDMINPCDPYELKDMKCLKEEYSEGITFVGGLDKFFFEWDLDKMKEFLELTLKRGGRGGGYIFMDSSGGIPENVSKEKFKFFMEISRELRYKTSY